MKNNDWNMLKRSVRNRFPRVSWITTEELARWLSDGNRKQPALFDVRTSEEWNVSHLPGAVRVEPNATAESVLRDIPAETSLVLYSSIGHRSAAFATRLIEAGFKNVVALEGSIFQWANERRPLVDGDGAPASIVHPYNPFWIGLLADDVRASLDRAGVLQS